MGTWGPITDVPGIRVGHVQKNDDGWLSGVTVVLPPPGTVGSVDVRGGGPGTHETDALDPTTLVVHRRRRGPHRRQCLRPGLGPRRPALVRGKRTGLPGGRGSGADRPRRRNLRPGPQQRLFSAPDGGHGLRGRSPPRRRKGTTSDAATSVPAPVL